MRYAAFIRKFLKVEGENGEEFKCFCPLHKNTRSPSFSINAETGLWRCFSTCGGGGLADLCKRAGFPAPDAVDPGLMVSGGTEDVKIVPEEVVERLAKDLWGKWGAEARHWLKKERGIEAETLRAFQIGFNRDTGRITFPIRDQAGKCKNVKYYDWMHVQRDKFLSYGPGYGDIRLFPASVAYNPDLKSVVLFEGEPDVLLAHSLGIKNACCATGGAGNWPAEFSRVFADRRVFIVYDIDEAGKDGAGTVARSLRLFAASVTIGKLPISEPANGDFTDFCRSRMFRRDHIISWLDGLAEPEVLGAKGPTATLNNVVESKCYGKKVNLRAVVQGKDMAPYQVPRVVKLVCKTGGKGKACAECPVKGLGGGIPVQIPIDSVPVLDSIASPNYRVEQAVKSYLDLPDTCRGASITVEETSPLWPVVLGNDLDSDTRENSYVLRTAFVREDLNPNTPYAFTVLSTKDPKTQEALLLCLQAKPSQTSLETWSKVGKEPLLKLWEA